MRAATFILLMLLATQLPAQIVGGEVETLHRFNGVAIGDSLGHAVSGAGDVDNDGFADLIVGAWAADPGGNSFAGSAYVYSGVGGALIYQYHGAAAFDELGVAVSGAGDVNNDGFDDFVIGASGASPGGLGSAGSAFVYSGLNGALIYQYDGEDVSVSLGSAVSAAGDVNNDGFDDFIIGSESARPNALFSAGSAMVYSGATGALIYRIDGTVAWDTLGHSVAGAGDVDGDGSDDFLIGAPLADPGGVSASGSAFVYSGASGLLLYQYDGTTTFDGMGESVAGAGDVDQDGFADFIIGAKSTDVGGVVNAGSAFVYSGASGLLLHRFDGDTSSTSFGISVSGAGDFDGDGFDDLIVGANTAAPGGVSNAGSALVYSGASGDLLFRADGEDSQDFLGRVSGAGDVDGDGRGDVIVGASGEDPSFITDAGSAYVYSHKPFLSASAKTVSAAAGATLDFTLDFPDAAAGKEYKILISETGNGPTTYGVDIPLTQDSQVLSTFQGVYPVPNTTGMHGILDASGNARADLTVPAGIPAALIGRIYWLAAIANAAGQLPEHSSVAVTIEITP